MSEPPASHRFVVGETEAGTRLDKLVQAHLGGMGRRALRELFARGAVMIGRAVASKGALARAGDEVLVVPDLPRRALPEPDLALAVRLERPELVVVAKPAGQPTAPLAGGERGTLVGALLGRYPEMDGIGFSPLEPGIVHRLDTQTSGLVVAARTRPAFERLRAALESGEIEKRYLAVVPAGALAPAGAVETPIGPDPSDPRRVAVGRGKPRRTEWRVVERRSRWWLVEVVAGRAYRHQIRAHLASLGAPIAGDELYGAGALGALRPRHALHASGVAFAGDAALAAFRVDEPLPTELRGLLEAE